ncbi:acyclic terpene utilization AtuA family protein [Nocardioides mesophilus]|uniref:Acyclic terpene utilization AtuA family protein n=1 Tax=Nocardioides mesophilus TaxID=433659 RepID=A0A7G9RFD3_9ACTN|nr:acyclic terpene utilization AtuA family protein [Nocardioides mesophilus]QNN54308.1 acyclic terpene utilization AtuA family protein [Nocardioides mesophilus]
MTGPGPGPASSPLRVGNCSGFYGDRLSAMREMLEGGSLDVLTGDYLAELTLLILGKDQLKDPALGYARTFVRQAEECLGLAVERGVRIVANAGGLNPAGLADRLREVATGLGLDVTIAHLDGDQLLDRADELGLTDPRLGKPLTANAYLGAFGIAAALGAGADVVVTGRVTDASLVVGPAIARHGWTRTSYDELAGATVAGHIIECGTQATGGNFSGFRDLHPDTAPLGFPVAEVAADGSCVITKHDGTGGAVTVDTVTAQLMYEIQGPAYLGPDVTTHLDTIELSIDGTDRVGVSGVRGSAPPEQLKVCLNFLGGFRNMAELVLVGLDIDAKADWARAQVEAALAARPPAAVEWSLARTDREDAATEETASARLRINVRDPDPQVAGKGFTAPLVELALASYPGFTLTAPPAPATPYGVYRAGYVPRDAVTERVLVEGNPVPVRRTAPDGGGGDTRSLVPRSPAMPGPQPRPLRRAPSASQPAGGVPAGAAVRSPAAGPQPRPLRRAPSASQLAAGPTRRAPLGTIVHARSGDKGGDANIGLWARDAAARPDRVAWLLDLVTPALVKRLLPEAEDLHVEVFDLPNLGGVNVLLHGLLGEGVAASSRFDPQAKALGEWIRSRHVDIPEALL